MDKKIDKGGRRKGIPKKTIGFKVPVAVAEEVKEQARPIIETITKKAMKKLIPVFILCLSLIGCTKSDQLQFTKVKVEQAGELIRVFGYLERSNSEPWRYRIEAIMRHTDGRVKTEQYNVDVAAGSVEGYADYQDSYKIMSWKIVYDDILRQ